MLDALVYREDGKVACRGEPAGIEHEREVSEHRRGAVALAGDTIDEVGARQVQDGAAHGAAVVAQ
jgi:hypothetical protein